MILLDANLLIYAHVESFAQNRGARSWLDEKLNGPAPVGIPWPSILAFVRIVTNPRIFEYPESFIDSWKQVEDWLSCESAWIPRPTERHREILGPLMIEQVTRSNLVPDAHLAALAIEHGLQLCSTDSDFSRFSELRWINPIA